MKGRLRIDFESLLPLITLVILGIFINQAQCAPAIDDEDGEGGCYYMFNHYGEGDRILTNEPCLNCTCHNSMLMCYLRVCPFTKPIGQDCTIEKKPDQCCPVITCPEEDVRIHTDQKKLLVPVSLVTPSAPSSTTPATTSLAPVSDSTELAPYERGCEMNGKYYADGAQVEGDPSKPCELCYCIRNRTACVMQECILHVEGCEPVFQSGVCCPVRYRCDYPPQITDESSSTIASVITTTIQSIFQTTPQPGGCLINGEYYADGSRIPGAERSPCEHCYCMRGEPVCAVQECGAPLENEAGNCTAVPPPPGHCCPEKFTCGDDEEPINDEAVSTPMAIIGETTLAPDVGPSDVSSDSIPSATVNQTELEPVRDGTTVLPIEPVEPEDVVEPVQSDPSEDIDSQTIPPTEAPVDDDKIESGPSTTSPISEEDAPPASAANQDEEDIVQTPTEASVPPTIFPSESQPQDQPEIPTEPTIVPGATDLPVASQDDTSSSTSEPAQVSSSTTESDDQTIFGTTVQPEPIPSENLQRPSSDKPVETSQDEPATTTPSVSSDAASSVAPSEETSASTVRPDETSTSARPVIPEMPEIIDVGSEEDMKPSEAPTISTERPVSDSQSGPSTESILADAPSVETATTERVSVQHDEESIGTTSDPLASADSVTDTPDVPDNVPSGDADSSDTVATTTSPSQTDTQQVSQDESALPTTSERPSQDSTDSNRVTTQNPPSSSDDGEEATSGIVSDDQTSDAEAASVQTTSQRPNDITDSSPPQDYPATSSPSVASDDAIVPTTPTSQVDVSTELPSSSVSSVDDDSLSQQDEAVTTTRPEVSVTEASFSPTVSDEGSQDSSTESGVSATTSNPSLQQQQDAASTLLPVTSERPEEIQSAAVDQQTTTRPDVMPEELPEDNEIFADPGDDSSSVAATSEKPVPESSTEDVAVTQPTSQQDESVTSSPQQQLIEGTTVSSAGQMNDEAFVQSTLAPGSDDGDDVRGSTQAPIVSQTETSQQDASSQEVGQSETPAPVAPESITSRPDTSALPSQDEQNQTDAPTHDATAVPEGTTSGPVSGQDLPSDSAQDQPENIEQGGSATTFSPELSPERLSTVAPPSNDVPESGDRESSTPTATQEEQDAGVQQADSAPTTTAPLVPASDDQDAEVQTTQSPSQGDVEDGIGQDETEQTTPSASSVVSADESVQPTTGKPSDSESSAETAVIQDEPEPASPVQPPSEQDSSTQKPEITTIASYPVESSSQQTGATDISSSEISADEAVTEVDSNAGLPTSQGTESSPPSATESSGISADQPLTTTQPLPSADESVSSSTDSELPAVESSTSAAGVVDAGGEVIGVESVSNSPDGSESLSMMKTSTAAPLPSEGGAASSSISPIDVGAPEDNEIVSDGASMEGEQSSSVPSVSSEPSSEISATTFAPAGTDSDESSSSSAPVSDASSSSSSDDAEQTTPGVSLPISEASTEGSSSSQTPDFDQPPEGINEIIPGTQQDSPDKISEQPEQVPFTTLSPTSESNGTQEVEASTISSSVFVPTTDSTSSSSQPVDGEIDSGTTPSSQQSKEDDNQPGDDSSIDVTSSPVADEPSATTAAAPVASQDDSSSGISSDSVTTQTPVSTDDSSSVASAQSDDTSDVMVTQTESSASDQGSSSSDEQASSPVTTTTPVGINADDAQSPATESVPIPAQPEGGISDVIPDGESGVGQEQTTPSSADVISDIKNQVADAEQPAQITTVRPEAGEITLTSTFRPQEISDDQRTELPVGGSDEPEISDQSAVAGQEDESAASQTPSPTENQSTTATVSTDDDETPVADAKPSEGDEQAAATTQQPSVDQQDIKDGQVSATTSRPITIEEGSGELPTSDEHIPTSLPESSASADEPVAGTTPSVVEQEQPLEQDQPSGTTISPAVQPSEQDQPTGTTLSPAEQPSAQDEPTGTTLTPAVQPSEQDEPTGTTLSPAVQPSEQDQSTGTTLSPAVQPSEQDEPTGTTLSPAVQPSEQDEPTGTTLSPAVQPSEQDKPTGTTLSPAEQPSEQDEPTGTTLTPAVQPSEQDEPTETTLRPAEQPSEQDQPAGTTSTPVVQPSEQQDEFTGTTVSPMEQPSQQNQTDDEPVPPATTLAPQTISQSTPESISTETEVPEDSEEIRHPDDNTGDDGEVDGDLGTTPALPENQTEGPASQQNEGVTTQGSVQDEPSVGQEQASSQGTTIRPEADIPTTPNSSIQGASDGQADEPATTERPSIITEQPISIQPDSALGMMSSTEKVEMDSGSSTTESSGDEESDSSTDSSVPGEGSCFVEGKTYRNGSSIPPTTPCHIACACKNSIVHCLLVHCPPPPARYVDCKPIYRSGVCCPDYDCGPTDEVSPVTITPEPPFADNKDDTVFTVTPEGTSTPSSQSLVSQQQESSERPTTESDIGIQDQPSEDGESGTPATSNDEAGIGTTSAPVSPSSQASFPTTVHPPSNPVSSTDAPSEQAQQDSTELPALATTTTASTTTSERPSDIEQIIDSSSSSPPEMASSGSDVAPEEDEFSPSTTTGPSAGSQYPVTTTTTVTPSSAPWPYPTSSTPPPGAMSSGACLFDGRVYMSAQQIPREDPCDFCFCFRGDIICLQQSCPPPIPGCYEEPIPGFCCPRYECPVGNGNHTTPPPLFPPSYYHNQILNNAASGSGQSSGSGMAGVPSGPGCEIQGEYFETGQVITSTSGPCLECRCGSTGMMECDPRECQPEPMLRKMIAAITSRRR